MLLSKQILFCSPSFFNYEQFIINELQNLGASVTFLSETHQKKRTSDYESKFLQHLNSNCFDFIFVIKGEKLTKPCLEAIKRYKYGKTILLQYDTIKRYTWIKRLLPYFENIYSFDHKDCIEYGFKFRPHFIPEDIYKLNTKKGIIENKISIVCSFYYDRFIILKKLRTYFKRKVDFYIYISRNKFLRNIHRLLPSDIFLLNYKKLSREEMLSHMINSSAVLDIEFEGQNGLTFRTLEALALERKLITTNDNIKSYKFYRDTNIFILSKDMSNLKELEVFLSIDIAPLTKEFYELYSIKKWCEDIFVYNRSSLDDHVSKLLVTR